MIKNFIINKIIYIIINYYICLYIIILNSNADIINDLIDNYLT